MGLHRRRRRHGLRRLARLRHRPAATAEAYGEPTKTRKRPKAGGGWLAKFRAKQAVRAAQDEAAEQEQIDRILAKVSAQGMQSLTWMEKRPPRKADRSAKTTRPPTPTPPAVAAMTTSSGGRSGRNARLWRTRIAGTVEAHMAVAEAHGPWLKLTPQSLRSPTRQSR